MDRTAVYALDRTHVLSFWSVLRLFEKTSDRVKISIVLIHDRLYYRPKCMFATKTDGWASSWSSQNHTADYSVLSQPRSYEYLVVECYQEFTTEKETWWLVILDVLDYLLYLSSTDIPCWVKENRCDSPWSVQCPQIVNVTRILRFTAMLNVFLRYFCVCTALLNAVRVH